MYSYLIIIIIYFCTVKQFQVFLWNINNFQKNLSFHLFQAIIIVLINILYKQLYLKETNLDADNFRTVWYEVFLTGFPGKGVAPSPTLRCSSYQKGSLLVALDYGRQLYFYDTGLTTPDQSRLGSNGNEGELHTP